MIKQTIPIKGMHCNSCTVLIAEELQTLPGVSNVSVSLRAKTATITAKKMPSQETIASAVQTAGYKVGHDDLPAISKDRRVYRDAAIGILIVMGLLWAFSSFNLGGVASLDTSSAGIGMTGLLLGLTAGFSTCMALIGGLVLGISARHAEKHPTATQIQKFRPHLFFNLGRIVSFTLLGGFIGALGAAFQLSGGLLGLLTIAIGFVMFALGLQLTGIFPRFKKAFSLPSAIGKRLGIKSHAAREYSHIQAFLLGGVTFFLPCGFTQATQLFAISTGSWMNGALIMGMFALGTTPGLLGIGGLTSAAKGAFSHRLFRIVGVVVMALAAVNVVQGYNLLGVNNWMGSLFSAASTQPPSNANRLTTIYKFNTDIVPSTFIAKVGQPTVLEVDVQDNGQGCMSTIMIPGLDDKPQYLKRGKTLWLSFTPKTAGTYQITCAMGIPRGEIKVEP